MSLRRGARASQPVATLDPFAGWLLPERDGQNEVITYQFRDAIFQAIRLNLLGVDQRFGEAEHQLPATPVGHVEKGVEVLRQDLLCVVLEIAPAILYPSTDRADLDVVSKNQLTAARSLSVSGRSMVCHS